jgi:hypothetical protein
MPDHSPNSNASATGETNRPCSMLVGHGGGWPIPAATKTVAPFVAYDVGGTLAAAPTTKHQCPCMVTHSRGTVCG